MARKKTPLKVYKIGLYGHTGSGKTCLIAALAMNKTPHPEGWTCGWLPGGCDNSNNNEQQLQESEQRLEQAIKALKQHGVPDPTPVRDKHLLFVFSFGIPGRSFQIELFDYAGELVDASKTGSDMAKALRQRLHEMDGWIVLSPAPRPNEEQRPLREYLHSLERSFNLLGSERQTEAVINDLPLAMVFNKWDRRSPIISHHTPEHEINALEEFLNSDPPPQHRSLYNSISNRFSADCFKKIPVSALGEHEISEVEIPGGSRRLVEHPKEIDPLHSFLLLEPFIWLVQQKDRLDIAAFKQAAAIYDSEWTGLKPWPFLGDIKQRGTALARRFSSGSPESKQVIPVLNRIRRREFTRGVSTIVVLLFILLIGDMGWDSHKYGMLKSLRANPEVSASDMKSVDVWLDSFIRSPPWRHMLTRRIILDRNTAQSELDSLRATRDIQLWARVETFAQQLNKNGEIRDPDNILEAVDDYLTQLPNGIHVEKAIRLKSESRVVKDNRIESALWKEVNAAAPDSKEQLSAAKDYLKQLPFGLHAPEAAEIVGRITAIESDADFARYVRDLIAGGDLLTAAHALQQRPDSQHVSGVRNELIEAVPQWLQKEVRRFIEEENWRAGESMLDQLNRWPPFVQQHSTIQEAKRSLKQDLYIRWDRAMYDKAIRDRKPGDLRTYLDEAPLKSMRGPISKYITWLERQDFPQKLTINLANIVWASDTNGADKLIVTVNGKTSVIESLEAEGASSENLALRFPVFLRLSDPISMDIVIIDSAWVGSDNIVARDRTTVALGRLSNFQISVGEHTLSFGLEGLVAEPILSTWRE